MAEQGGEKTEAPTQRRREQAREKGDLLTSRELATALVGVSGALWLWLYGGDLAEATRLAAIASLSLRRDDILVFEPADALFAMLRPLAGPLLALGVMAMVAAVLGRVLTGGFGFNISLWTPKASRMNPLAGLKRIFGTKGLIELVKALGKSLLLIGLSAWILYGQLPVFAGLSAMQFDAALSTMGTLAIRLILILSCGLLLIAGSDLPVQFIQWLKRLRMTKQEVKDEFRQQEGSPEVKHAIRRMARENLKRANRGAMADATVVLTNPTHFAVALRYRPEQDAAPVIVARGRGLMAEVIRDLAAERQIAILSYPSVARAVYFTGKVGMMIRPDLYMAVATILAFVLRVGAEMNGEEPPEVEAPESASFDADGRMMAG